MSVAVLRPKSFEELRPAVTEELLADITRRIVTQFHPKKIILFGSYAYGTPHKDSDVDLFIIMESDEDIFRRIVRVREVAHVDYLPMDVIVRTPAELEQRLAIGDYFVREILERGKVLYDNGVVAR